VIFPTLFVGLLLTKAASAMIKALSLLAVLSHGVNGESLAITDKNWDTEIQKKVDAGGFAFVKFQAPW